MKKSWYGLLGSVVLLFGCDSGSASKPTLSSELQENRPNILLYIIDTLRPDGLSAYGNTQVDTPAIDAFAKTGTLFENAYAPTSWTRASVASILTATPPTIHGATLRDDQLASSAVLASEMLQGHGYHTGLITTNPNVGSFFGFDQGFDEFIELYSRREVGFVRAAELMTTADSVAEQAKEWIRNAPRPFFLVVIAIDPHSPYQPPDRYDRYGEGLAGTEYGSNSWINRKDLSPEIKQRIRSLYDAEIAFSDHAFGLLMDGVRELGLFEQTITILTSDHGEEFWEHGSRGHGLNLFDEVLRVPMIVSYPPTVPAGGRENRVAQLMDIIPTVFDLAGLAIPPDSGDSVHLDGSSLFGADRPENPTTLATLHLRGANQVSIREGHWKLIWDQSSGQRMLFDTSSGRGEVEDLSADHPDRVRALSDQMTQQLRENRQRSNVLSGGRAIETISPDGLPPAERKLLEELGYLESEEDAL